MRFAGDGRIPATAKHSFSLGEPTSNSNYSEDKLWGLVSTRLSRWFFCVHLHQKCSVAFVFAGTVANL